MKQLSEKTVRISVSDTGIGVPQENRKVIFQLFGQMLHHSKRFQSFGAGLGLTISNLLAKMLANSVKSEIQLKDNKSKGSKFSFIIVDLLAPRRPLEKEHSKAQQHNIQMYTKMLLS